MTGAGGKKSDNHIMLESSTCSLAVARLDWPSLRGGCAAAFGAGGELSRDPAAHCTCLQPFDLPRERVHAQSLDGQGGPALVRLQAAPKAGSQSLRQLVSSLDATRTVARGHWNGAEGNCTVPAGTLASALVVRDPVLRFASGVVEMFSTHCKAWHQWRRAHNRSTSGGLHVQPRREERARPTRHGKPTSCRAVWDARPDGAAWSHPEALALLAREYVRDMAYARSIGSTWPESRHTDPQVVYAFRLPGPRLDAILPLERMAGANGWPLFRRAAGLAPGVSFPHTHRNAQKLHSSPYSSAAVFAHFGDEAWSEFCALFSADHVCLGYDLPPRCAAAALQRRVSQSSRRRLASPWAWQAPQLSKPCARTLRVVSMSFHDGTQNAVMHALESLNRTHAVGGACLAVTQFRWNPPGWRFKEADIVRWLADRAEPLARSFDLYITSDTAVQAQLLLRSVGFDKPLVIWVCNRFDAGARWSIDGDPASEAWRALLRAVLRDGRGPGGGRVLVVPNAKAEVWYARTYRNVSLGAPIIRPAGQPSRWLDSQAWRPSAAPPEATRADRIWISPHPNEKRFGVAAMLEKRGVRVYQPRSRQYGGPAAVRGFKAAVHLPYTPSSVTLFELLAVGVVYCVPSAGFIMQLAKRRAQRRRGATYLYQMTDSNFDVEHVAAGLSAALLGVSEWWATDMRPLFVYFDSWDQLVQLVRNETLLEQKRTVVRAWAHAHAQRTTEQWAGVLRAALKQLPRGAPSATYGRL